MSAESDAIRVAADAVQALDFRAAAVATVEVANHVGARSVEGSIAYTAQAQVYATLALVEQQRAANVIAYWQLHTPRTTDGSLDDATIDVRLVDGIDEEELRELIGIPV